MISKIYPIQKKLSFATKQGNAWRLRRTEAKTAEELAKINLIISLIEEDKETLKSQLNKAQNAQK